MSEKEAVYILVGLLAVTTVWFLVVERSYSEDEEDCGCNG